MWLYFVVGILGFVAGFRIGRHALKNWMSQDLEQKAREQAEEKLLAINRENQQIIEQMKRNAQENFRYAKNEIDQRLAAYQAENDKKRALLEGEMAQLRNAKTFLEEGLEQKRAELSGYEEMVIKTKIRILQKVKAERELELAKMNNEYAERIREVTEAISVIQEKLNEWSGMERAAYEERVGREANEERGKLALGSRIIEELRELYGACEKLKLANPTPLYKAIYELYFRGPVKELGVSLGAVGKCGIYKVTNVVNGKVYVGQSVDIAERWKQHIKRGVRCDVGTLSGAGLYEAMWEDGIWNFSFCILEECDRSILNRREKAWIEQFQSNEIGYNKRT